MIFSHYGTSTSSLARRAHIKSCSAKSERVREQASPLARAAQRRRRSPRHVLARVTALAAAERTAASGLARNSRGGSRRPVVLRAELPRLLMLRPWPPRAASAEPLRRVFSAAVAQGQGSATIESDCETRKDEALPNANINSRPFSRICTFSVSVLMLGSGPRWPKPKSYFCALPGG
jgi:hypothetical protein